MFPVMETAGIEPASQDVTNSQFTATAMSIDAIFKNYRNCKNYRTLHNCDSKPHNPLSAI